MKTFPKILIILFLTVFIICLFFLLLAPAASQAADPATFKPQIEIPGIEKEFGAPDSKTGGYAIPGSTASIAKYIRVIYKYAIGIVGILAAVVLMIGGVIWITAGGNAERIGEAKAWIASSLTGLLLALLSYTILATVNPALVNFQTTAIEKPQNTNNNNLKSCCLGQSGNFAWDCFDNLSQEDCNKKKNTNGTQGIITNTIYAPDKGCKKQSNYVYLCE